MTYISGHIENSIPIVKTKLDFNDILGAIKVRWAVRRNNYKVKPGLYAVGNPDKQSDIFVSANYKLSFDHLRKNIDGLDAWILVLDTNGINVWCAAGKGIFGTKELISKIKEFLPDGFVEKKKVIVPQLGAVGVAAHEVENETGFKVKWGPVRAKEIKAYIANNYKSTKEMRTVHFSTKDRLILTPVEIVGHFKYFISLVAALFILSCFRGASFNVDYAWNYFYIPLINLSSAYVLGTFVVPVLLPYIPFRNFSFKGILLSIILSAILLYFNLMGVTLIEQISWFMINIAITSFTAMNFTGSTTFTSLSGVKKEMKIAIPVQILFFVLGVILWTITRFNYHG